MYVYLLVMRNECTSLRASKKLYKLIIKMNSFRALTEFSSQNKQKYLKQGKELLLFKEFF